MINCSCSLQSNYLLRCHIMSFQKICPVDVPVMSPLFWRMVHKALHDFCADLSMCTIGQAKIVIHWLGMITWKHVHGGRRQVWNKPMWNPGYSESWLLTWNSIASRELQDMKWNETIIFYSRTINPFKGEVEHLVLKETERKLRLHSQTMTENNKEGSNFLKEE